MRSPSSVAAAAMLALVAGCATLPPCPAKGGPAWSELRSAHFTVRTDLDSRAADELVRELEEARAAILAIGWPNAGDPPGRVEVVAFRTERELRALIPEGGIAAWRKTQPFPATLLVNGADGLDGFSPIAHEVTHDLAFRFLPFQPPWFSEGVATYFETIVYDRKKGEVQVGLATPARYGPVVRGWKRFSKALVSSRGLPAGRAGATFEDASWLLFHHLVDDHPTELARYQDLLRQLTPWDRAWKEAFPNLSFDELDNELEDCVRRERLRNGTVKIVVTVGDVQRRPLRDAEVHALRAYLRSGSRDTRALVSSEVTEAIAQEPENDRAIAAAYYLSDAPADAKRSLAQRAANANPTSWLAAVTLADALGTRDPGARAALLRALPTAPAEPEVLRRLAQLDAEDGRWEQAVALAERTIHLGESENVHLLTAYSRALAHTGRCGEARFVLDALGGLAAPKQSELVARATTDVSSACATSAAPR